MPSCVAAAGRSRAPPDRVRNLGGPGRAAYCTRAPGATGGRVPARDWVPRGVATYEDVYRFTYVRGPSGILLMLAEELQPAGDAPP